VLSEQIASTLPTTAELLVAGGDTRIMLDPASGATIYGSRPCPDPELIALGSCTASLISVAGPTFCGALLVPPATAARYLHACLGEQIAAYSNAAEWPQGWPAARKLPHGVNFGLLLRWQAAMTQMRHFMTIPDRQILGFIDQFARTVQQRLTHDACFEALPVAALERTPIGRRGGWDTAQTIFPFLVYRGRGASGRRPLTREDTRHLYELLREPAPGAPAPRFQLGQPVPCGERDGIPVSALRLCVGAPMLVSASDAAGIKAILAGVHGALDRIAELVDKL
jgi:hypothetical protein